MEIKRERTVAAQSERTEIVTDHILCDLCGKKGAPGWVRDPFGDGPDGNVWQVTLGLRAHHLDPELASGYVYTSGYWTETLYHICPKCFLEKVQPWLESQGAKPTTREVDV